MKEIQKEIDRALGEGALPGGVLRVELRGETVINKPFGVLDSSGRVVTTGTFYDLASLTKPLATTVAVMALMECGDLEPGSRAGDIVASLKGTDMEAVTVSSLMEHNSGLAAWKPFYEQIDPFAEVPERRESIKTLIRDEPLSEVVGGRAVYSDIGYMLLCWIVETVSGLPLDVFVEKYVYEKIGLKGYFWGTGDLSCCDDVAPTEACGWRGRPLCGEVHDENAWAWGGVSGHAGLFGRAEFVGLLLSSLLKAWHGDRGSCCFSPETIRMFWNKRDGSGRAWGFDVPSGDSPSSGSFFPAYAIGHLGFTGTSFWVDPEKKLIVTLLTNRVCPTRENLGIRSFRPRIHDAVMKDLGISLSGLKV